MSLELLSRKFPDFLTFAAVSYRIPLPVRRIAVFSCGNCYPVCPRCGRLLDREFMAYCDHCGQCLGWTDYQNAAVILK